MGAVCSSNSAVAEEIPDVGKALVGTMMLQISENSSNGFNKEDSFKICSINLNNDPGQNKTSKELLMDMQKQRLDFFKNLFYQLDGELFLLQDIKWKNILVDLEIEKKFDIVKMGNEAAIIWKKSHFRLVRQWHHSELVKEGADKDLSEKATFVILAQFETLYQKNENNRKQFLAISCKVPSKSSNNVDTYLSILKLLHTLSNNNPHCGGYLLGGSSNIKHKTLKHKIEESFPKLDKFLTKTDNSSFLITNISHDAFEEYPAKVSKDILKINPLFTYCSINSNSLQNKLDENKVINISNLDEYVRVDDLKKICNEVGQVNNVIIHYDKTNGKPTGRAQVVFKTDRQAIAAMRDLNDKLINEKRIQIELDD